MPETSSDLCIEHAAFVLPGGELSDTLKFFIETLGFRLDGIMPADDPRTARLSGHGLRIFLDTHFKGDPGVVQLNTTDDVPRASMTAPNGTLIEFTPARLPMTVPPLRPRLTIQQLGPDDNAWKTGRAGMQYRDLIPDRQGGQFIASHIRIPHGGPVGDNVHHHDIGLQLIYCYRGWVRLVYEDQGEPFFMHPGDCVLQPPNIRHRVLESSDGLEVIEIGSPAEHLTSLDHQMILPTGHDLPERDFSGQRFAFHLADQAEWISGAQAGVEQRDLGISAATRGFAGAHVLRRAGKSGLGDEIIQSRTFMFSFLLEGSMQLRANHGSVRMLRAGDAFVIPHGMPQQFIACSEDWQLLQVFLPG